MLGSANRSNSDIIYAQSVTPGTVEVPPHDGKDGNNYGIPHALVVRPLNPLAPVTKSLLSTSEPRNSNDTDVDRRT